MKSFLKDNWLFYTLYFLLLVWAGYYLASYDKVALHRKVIALNGNVIFDTVYKYITHIGDGIFAAIVALIIAIYNLRDGLYLLSSYIISGLMSAVLKNYVYDDIDRPFQVFTWTLHEKLPEIEGVDTMIHNSFPSGHSTTAFAVFTCIALMQKNKFVKFLCLFIGTNAAFSRTFISQHWLVDVYFGSLLGLITATVLYFVFFNPGYSFVSKLQRPLFIKKA